MVTYCNVFLDELFNFSYIIPNPGGNILDVSIDPNYVSALEVYYDTGLVPG